MLVMIGIKIDVHSAWRTCLSSRQASFNGSFFNTGKKSLLLLEIKREGNLKLHNKQLE